MMQHNKNVEKERRAIAPLPLFATILLVWLLKFSNGLLRGGEIYLLRHSENLPYLPLKLCSGVMILCHWPSIISNPSPPPPLIPFQWGCASLDFGLYLSYIWFIYLSFSCACHRNTLWSHFRLWCLITLHWLQMRTIDRSFLYCFNNRKMFRVHWNGFNKNEMKQLTITNRCIFKFYSRGISCSSSDNEKEQVKGDSSPLLIGWNHHFLRIQHVDSNICREQLILMYDATDLSDENEKLTHYS